MISLLPPLYTVIYPYWLMLENLDYYCFCVWNNFDRLLLTGENNLGSKHYFCDRSSPVKASVYGMGSVMEAHGIIYRSLLFCSQVLSCHKVCCTDKTTNGCFSKFIYLNITSGIFY